MGSKLALGLRVRTSLGNGGPSRKGYKIRCLHRDRFHDSESQKDFDENFSDEAIHLERHVILSDFPDIPLHRAFSSWDWESLCEKPSRCPGMFIQEFYSNIHAIDTSIPQFNTIFRGARIVVTLELIFKVLHVHRVACPDYPSHPCLCFIS